MFIQFISGIILARLLTPYDYGCIGMLSIFMVLAEAFIDGGFGSALIQKEKPTQDDYSTIFFWNLGMSVVMYSVLFLSAPAIARFYDMPILCNVLRVEGLLLFIYAFNIVQRNQLRKKLNFKVLSIVTVATAVFSLLVTVFLAYKGFGVWALVVQHLLTAAIPALVFWFVIKWRPKKVFSVQSLKELFSFGAYMFLTHLLNSFSTKIQGLLIGKVYSPATMGYYSKAHSTESLASSSISSIMTQVSYPLYATAQNDLGKLSNMIKRMTVTISYISFPLLFLLLLLAKPVFLLLYSDRWLESVPYFQVLCFAGMGSCLTAVNTQAIAAIGKSKLMFIWTVVKRVVGISAIVGGLLAFGMEGLLAGVVFNCWFSYFVNIALVSKHVGYKWTRQLLDLLPVVLVSSVIAAVCFGLGRFLNLGLYLNGIVIFFVYVSLYLAWSVVFKPDAYTYSLTLLPQFFKKGGKGGRPKVNEV